MRKGTKVSTNFTIPLYIYPFQVIVSVGQDDDKVMKVCRSAGIEDAIELVCTGPNQYCCWPKYLKALIKVEELPTSAHGFGILSHEILHVVISIMRTVGMRIEDGNGADEAYTYLMSYLTEQIYTKLNKYY